MRRIFCYTVLMTLNSAAAFAQITVQQSSLQQLFGLGNVVQMYADTTEVRPTVNTGLKGGPRVYDFSTLKFAKIHTDTMKAVSTIPYLASRFPGTALVLTFPGSAPGDYDHNIMRFQTGVLEQLGNYEKDGNIVYVDYRNTPEPMLFFPSDYQDSVRYDYNGVDSTYTDGSLTSNGGSTHPLDHVIDGYGTLMLPDNQSFPCLRIRVQEYPSYNYKGFIYLTANGLMLMVESQNTSPDEGDVENQGVFYLRSPVLTSVSTEATTVPSAFRMNQNYPNPFNPATTIRFVLESPTTVKLVVYDLLGRPVTTLINGVKGAGEHSVTWEAGNRPAGVYYYTLTAGSFSETRKMLLVK